MGPEPPDNSAVDVLNFDVIEEEDDFRELGSDADLLLDCIKDPIDRLYKVSTWIRNPSSRFASSKVLYHQEIDVESKIDLLQAFADFDYDYVSSVFLQYRKSKALKDGLQPKPSTQEARDKDADKVWEPIQSVLWQHRLEISNQTESFLIRRIAQANVRRRQQFAYWKKHRNKLSYHSTVAAQHVELSHEPKHTQILSEMGFIKLSPATIPPAPSVTTASHLQISQLTINDDDSRISVSEYAPSVSHPNQEIVDFPQAPKRPSGEKFFECPYCFTLCPNAILGQKAWK